MIQRRASAGRHDGGRGGFILGETEAEALAQKLQDIQPCHVDTDERRGGFIMDEKEAEALAQKLQDIQPCHDDSEFSDDDATPTADLKASPGAMDPQAVGDTKESKFGKMISDASTAASDTQPEELLQA